MVPRPDAGSDRRDQRQNGEPPGEHQKLNPDLERFKGLDKDIQTLNIKLDALKNITVSKISKYKPVIVLEHLQNLKPDGVWFSHVAIGTSLPPLERDKEGANGNAIPESLDAKGSAPVDNDSFEVVGQAFDNLLTAELMTAIRSTGSQELDEGDLRTQVFFADLALRRSRSPRRAPRFQRSGKVSRVRHPGQLKERTVAAKPQTDPVQGDDDKDRRPPPRRPPTCRRPMGPKVSP